MKPIDFLRECLNEYAKPLGIASALYEYHPYSEVHFLKIFPSEVIETEKFNKELSYILFSFEDKFPGESLCFLDDYSLTTLEKPVELIQIEITADYYFSEMVFSENELATYCYNFDAVLNEELINVDALLSLSVPLPTIAKFIPLGSHFTEFSEKYGDNSLCDEFAKAA